MYQIIQEIHNSQGIWAAILFISTFTLLSLIVYHTLFSILRLRFIATYTKSPPLLRKYVYYPGLYLALLLCLALTYPVLRKHLPQNTLLGLVQVYQVIFIICITFLIRRLVIVFREVLFSYLDTSLNDEDNLEDRKALTQFKVIERVVSFLIIIAAIALILMTFKAIRQIGVSLLASAGVIGIVIGFAAQKSIANIVAGIQLAFAQPIRLGDVVIVEGEWGRIEEITLTYVIVKIWDERRLVVPLNHFIEKPFQNWTRQSTELVGAVFLYLDYSAPIEELRQELERIIQDNPLWDGRTSNIKVTDATEKTLQVRIVVSARNASDTFDLRCLVRENLVSYLQKHYPHALPTNRVLLASANDQKPNIFR